MAIRQKDGLKKAMKVPCAFKLEGSTVYPPSNCGYNCFNCGWNPEEAKRRIATGVKKPITHYISPVTGEKVDYPPGVYSIHYKRRGHENDDT